MYVRRCSRAGGFDVQCHLQFGLRYCVWLRLTSARPASCFCFVFFFFFIISFFSSEQTCAVCTRLVDLLCYLRSSTLSSLSLVL